MASIVLVLERNSWMEFSVSPTWNISSNSSYVLVLAACVNWQQDGMSGRRQDQL